MSTRRRAARPAVTVLVVLLGAVLLAGCVSLPSDGPVVQPEGSRSAADPGPMYIDPLPPQPGQSPSQVVKGFLDAMLATPVQTTTARQFLSRGARDSWDPSQQTITFADSAPPRGDETVTVALDGARRIDARGAWQGDLGAQSVSFELALEDGQYRITQAPDALVVPEQWYEQRFRQVSLYFFDPTASILVPEPVFVPDGDQLASTLVRGLLAGPPTTTAGSAQSFFPPGVTAGLSVPVSGDGVADIALTGADEAVDRDQAERLVAQLTTTLRQDPAVTAVRVTLDGRPLDLAGDEIRLGLDRGEPWAPYVARSSSLLYGLRDGLLVGGGPGDLAPVGGPFGTSVLGVRAVVPDLPADQAAAISTDGTSVLLGPVREDGAVVQVISGATDLLPPVWDFSGRLWLVDRTPDGARVLQRRGEVARPLDVPGVSGQDVRAVLVSRDGSRLVAVVRGGGAQGGDTVVVSRILHDAEGRVLAATPAIRIDADGEGPVRVRDIAWRSPTGIAVMTQLNDDLYQVRALPVDGAPGGLGALSTTVKGDVRELAGSPAPGQRLYAAGPGLLVPLTGTGAGQVPLDVATTALGYAGG